MVIDDLRIERLHLRRLVEGYPTLEWIGEADSAETALPMILELRPDVLLLDVELPGANAFSLLKKLGRTQPVVFVSAWPAYAVEAMELHAVDYLLKPVKTSRFTATVLRISRLFAELPMPRIPHDEADRICLRTADSTVFLPLQGISTLKAQGSNTEVHHAQLPPVIACQKLSEFDAVLPSPLFMRLDGNLIINMGRLLKVEKTGRDTGLAWMRGPGTPVQLSPAAMARLVQLGTQVG